MAIGCHGEKIKNCFLSGKMNVNKKYVYIIFNGTYMDIYVQVDDKHDDLLINYG
jgi:hypothetical protein